MYTPCTFQYEEEHINLTVTTCPPGLALYPNNVEDEYECKCDDDNDQNIFKCLPDERRLILKVCIYIASWHACKLSRANR